MSGLKIFRATVSFNGDGDLPRQLYPVIANSVYEAEELVRQMLKGGSSSAQVKEVRFKEKEGSPITPMVIEERFSP